MSICHNLFILPLGIFVVSRVFFSCINNFSMNILVLIFFVGCISKGGLLIPKICISLDLVNPGKRFPKAVILCEGCASD